MRFPRRVLAYLALTWALVVLYPDPTVLVASARNLLAPPIDPGSARSLAATLPNDPREIERRVLEEVLPYASDWETAGVPWSFPTVAQALGARRGDCESRALVIASVLAAKGIPYRLRMSFDHIWVYYSGKVPTASENEARVLVGRGRGGWFGLSWPDDFEPGRELRAQLAIYWDPMPNVRKALLIVGLGWIVLWNALATARARPTAAEARRRRSVDLRGAPTPSSAGSPS